MPPSRRRRVEILIDNRMLGFLRPTPVAGPMGVRRKKDSLEFLLPQQGRADSQGPSSGSKAS